MNRIQFSAPVRFSSGIYSLFGLSQHGGRHPVNEDRYLIKALPEACVLTAVADGLSGRGDWAAQTVIDAIGAIDSIPAGLELQVLRETVLDIDRKIYRRNYLEGEFQGMGSTLVCALLRRRRYYWIHAGDSRLYLWRDDVLTQITRDQTLARFLLEEGEISDSQVSEHYSRHVMDQYIGCGHCDPETGSMPVLADDRFLFCSDGLHRTLDPDILQAAFDMQKTPKQVAAELMSAAIGKVPDDDITLVVCMRKRNVSL